MSLRFFSQKIKVGTTPDTVMKFRPKLLHSIVIKADAAVELGDQNLAVGTGGAPLEATESFTILHTDFDQSALTLDDIVDVRGVAPVATTVRIMQFMKG